MFPKFFENDEFLIDEKVGFFKISNAYKIFDNKGNQIGFVREKMSTGLKLLTFLINKAMMPFTLNIEDGEGNILVSIKRGWTFLMSKISINNAQGETLGYIKQKFTFFKSEFQVFDVDNNMISVIKGDWRAWNFEIKDGKDNLIGTVSKKWAGALKELFTTADKYYVKINPEFAEDKNKIIILSAAITIDMVLKESK